MSNAPARPAFTDLAFIVRRIVATPQTLAAARGWRRRGLAFGLGVLLALSFAPFYVLPLMAVAFSGAVFLLDGLQDEPRPLRAAAATGWWFGMGFFLVSLHWVAFAFLVQAAAFGWMAPFAVIGLGAFLASYHGLAFALAARMFVPSLSFETRSAIAPQDEGEKHVETNSTPHPEERPKAASRRIAANDTPPALRIIIFAAAFMALEYARGHFFTGMPWNLPGQALAGFAAGGQAAAWFGVYGLSLIAVVIACLPAAFFKAGGTNTSDIKAGARLAKGALACIGAFAVLTAIGFARLSLHQPTERTDVAVRIIQPNIPQREKIDPALWGRNVRRAIDLSSGPADGTRTLYVLWPENAASLIDESPDALSAIDMAFPPGAYLLTGAVRRSLKPDGGAAYHNALAIAAPINKAPPENAALLDPPSDAPSRAFVDFYDKHHLVPFGEYLPLQPILRAVGLAQLAPFEDGFKKGAGPRTLTIGPAPFAPLICYEAIFPGAMHPKNDRPDWLAVVTNDAWFGDASGPLQHLDQARLRTIETGLPMARAANTGVSTLIDGAGRYVAQTPLYETGIIDAPLPAALPPTFYSKFGDLSFFILCASFFSIQLIYRGLQSKYSI